ncbi:MAG: histidine phosphatase family protein [Rhodospirillaceae bacterium]
MTPLALIRHGPTEWNEQKKLQGQSDIPLSPAGWSKVARWELPQEFKEWNWYASPMSRAQQTAELLGLKPAAAPDLVEMHWGDWEGKTGSEIEAEFGDSFRHRASQGIDMRPPKGESPREVRQRVSNWITDKAKEQKPFGAVAHQGIVRAALSLATGWEMVGPPPFEMDWASVHIFTVDKDGGLSVDRLNISLEDG